MQDKALIRQIKELRGIKPDKNWASLTKTEIMGPAPEFSFLPYLRPAFASFAVFFLLFGGFFVVKQALPGDILYTIRKISHQTQVVFMAEADKPAYQLKLANDRLEDLTNVPAKNLAPTIFEFQANISEAVRDLTHMEATTSDPVIMKKIVAQALKLEENKLKVESLGVVLGDEGTNELDQAFARLTENLIKDLEDRELNETQTVVLSKVKELFEKEQFYQSLEYYLLNQ